VTASVRRPKGEGRIEPARPPSKSATDLYMVYAIINIIWTTLIYVYMRANRIYTCE